VHLALCLYRYTPFGGLERNAFELARAAHARGHRVSVLTRAWSGARPDGIEVHELPVRAWTNVGRDAAFARALARELPALAPDVTVAFNRIAGVDVFYAADPCLAAARDAPGRLALPNRRQRAAWERALAAPSGSTELLVQSEREEQRFRAHHATPAARLHVLPPGLRPEFLRAGPARAPELRAALSVPAAARLVLAVGSDFARKGLDRTLAALAALPEAQRARTWLVVLGAGKARRFARAARDLGLAARVRFTGGRTDVLAAYRAADLLLHPAREENTGTVLLEAASQGVAVVCSAECGFATLLERARAGVVLASPFDAHELAHTTGALLADDARRARLGARGRALARAFPMEARTARALAVIERVARAKR
jgi:UDP-glucose:(heptosyl)LPS alpha-1,3-glucosyltransferase